MSLCRQCGSEVSWVRCGGKLLCLNPDDETDHWDRCAALRFQRIKREGEHFKTKSEEGYRTRLKRSGVLFVHQVAKKRQGPKRISGNCRDCSPPWEDPCAECPDKLETA